MALGIVSLLMLVPASAFAAPAWQPPQLVSGLPGYDQTIAMSETGDALAVWLEGESDSAQVNRYAWRTPHGGWGPARDLPGLRTGNVAIGMSSFGHATVAYFLPDGDVGVATALAGQPLGQIETLDSPKPILPGFGTIAVAVDDEGGATVAWTQTPKAFVATRRPGARFSEPQQLDNVGSFGVALAVNPAGAAVVAYGVGSEEVLAAYRLPGEMSFGRAEDVPRAARVGSRPFAAIKDDGTAIVATSGSNPHGLAPTGVTFSERPAVGRFGPEQRVNSGSDLEALVAEPQSASSFIANVRAPDAGAGAMTVTTRASNGSLGSPTVLSDEFACNADAASNPLGQLIVAYTNPCPVNPFGGAGSGVKVRRRGAAGAAFDAPVTLTSDGSYPKVAQSASGDAIVAFYQSVAARTVIVSSAFEDPAAGVAAPVKPVIGGGKAPVATLPEESGLVGLPVTCPTACTVAPEGIITTDGIARATSATIGKRTLRTKQRRRVRVRFSKMRIRQARRALRRGDSATVSYIVKVRGRKSSPRSSFSRRVRLKLPRQR